MSWVWALMLGVWLLAGPFFVLLTALKLEELIITFVILFWLVAGEAPSNKSSSTSRLVSLGGTHSQY